MSVWSWVGDVVAGVVAVGGLSWVGYLACSRATYRSAGRSRPADPQVVETRFDW